MSNVRLILFSILLIFSSVVLSDTDSEICDFDYAMNNYFQLMDTILQGIATRLKNLIKAFQNLNNITDIPNVVLILQNFVDLFKYGADDCKLLATDFTQLLHEEQTWPGLYHDSLVRIQKALRSQGKSFGVLQTQFMEIINILNLWKTAVLILPPDIINKNTFVMPRKTAQNLQFQIANIQHELAELLPYMNDSVYAWTYFQKSITMNQVRSQQRHDSAADVIQKLLDRFINDTNVHQVDTKNQMRKLLIELNSLGTELMNFLSSLLAGKENENLILLPNIPDKLWTLVKSIEILILGAATSMQNVAKIFAA